MRKTRVTQERAAFEGYWETVILPSIEDLLEADSGLSCPNVTRAKKRIWQAYLAFSRHCSKNYMADSEKPLDRHKVAACYAYAVLAAFPIQIDSSLEPGDSYYLANERLALQVGCSVIASYDCEVVEESTWDEGKKKRYFAQIHGGVNFPKKNLTEDYLDVVLSCLCFTAIEENYNIRMLSLLYFHWEQLIFATKKEYDEFMEMHDRLLANREKRVS